MATHIWGRVEKKRRKQSWYVPGTRYTIRISSQISSSGWAKSQFHIPCTLVSNTCRGSTELQYAVYTTHRCCIILPNGTINGYISTGSTHPLESQQLPFFRAQHQPPAHVLSPRESRGPERASPAVRRGHRNAHGSFAVTPLHQLLQHAASQRVSSRQKQKR